MQGPTELLYRELCMADFASNVPAGMGHRACVWHAEGRLSTCDLSMGSAMRSSPGLGCREQSSLQPAGKSRIPPPHMELHEEESTQKICTQCSPAQPASQGKAWKARHVVKGLQVCAFMLVDHAQDRLANMLQESWCSRDGTPGPLDKCSCAWVSLSFCLTKFPTWAS